MAGSGDDDYEYRIKDGDYVVLKRDEIYKAVQIQLKRKVIFEKQWIFLDKAVGHLYNTTFEVVSGGILQPLEVKDTKSLTESKVAGTDNRWINDDGNSQKMTKDDIEILKVQGLKSQDIIEQLIDSSSTFANKTEYSQEKYIKKKKKKYENTVTILKPTCRILAMMYHGRERGKICHMRYDTLAQMLTLANIHAGCKVLVFETCAGLVLGSIMERMGGYGSVIQMYPGGGPVRGAVESFGFPAHFHNMLHEFPICQVNALMAGTLDAAAKDSDADEKQVNMTADEEQNQQEDGPEEQSMEKTTSDGTKRDQENIQKEERRQAKAQERKVKQEEKLRKLEAAAALLEGRNADGLVIASRFHPCPVLLRLIEFLSPSRPFVVYSQYLEPLIECYTKLKERGGTVNLRITDTWLRKYQVLSDRTHPLLLMSGGGGYVLSGTLVALDRSKPASSPQDEEPAPKKQKLKH
ncbi:tRNA (adenine(58)-N(1))-methyltransferase non-catalytic subunit TRM6 [Xenentodon cancila]